MLKAVSRAGEPRDSGDLDLDKRFDEELICEKQYRLRQIGGHQ